jgi:peptidoglycan/LPS O-acetylase OafA/YrhL
VTAVAPGAPDTLGRTTKKAELRQLTGLRALVAAWVVLDHFHEITLALVPEAKPATFVFVGGVPAVVIFFVLSGYIISYQYLRAFPRGRGQYLTFIHKRFARLYPLHIVTLAFLVVLVLGALALGIPVTPASSFTWGSALQDVFLVRGWVIPVQGWNFPAWSLSVEWFAYLVFPGVSLLMGWLSRSRALLGALLVVCVVVMAVTAVVLPGFNDLPHPLVEAMLGFLSGAALCVLGPFARFSAAQGWIAMAVFAAMVGFNYLVPTVPLHAAVALVGAIAIVQLLSGSTTGPVARFLGSGPMEYGGRLSFGIYVCHGIVLMVLAVALGGLLQVVPLDVVQGWPLIARIGLSVLAMLIPLPIAMFLHRFVERPAQAWITAPLRRRTPPAAEIDP